MMRPTIEMIVAAMMQLRPTLMKLTATAIAPLTTKMMAIIQIKTIMQSSKMQRQLPIKQAQTAKT
jgi:hypothetical protein